MQDLKRAAPDERVVLSAAEMDLVRRSKQDPTQLVQAALARRVWRKPVNGPAKVYGFARVVVERTPGG